MTHPVQPGPDGKPGEDNFLVDAEAAITAVGGRKALLSKIKLAQEVQRHLTPDYYERSHSFIADHWAGYQHGTLEATAQAQLSPAERQKGIEHVVKMYGGAVTEIPEFLAQFVQNLSMFQGRATTRKALERADLASRHSLPPEVRPDKARYAAANVSAVAAYEEGAIGELEAEFQATGNPLFAWEALDLIRHDELPIPVWVRGYLEQCAAKFSELRCQISAGRRRAKPVADAGTAVGFSGTRRGGRAAFFQASQRALDRSIFLAVRKLENDRHQLTYARQQIAKDLKIGERKVRAAYDRGAALVGEPKRLKISVAGNRPISDSL